MKNNPHELIDDLKVIRTIHSNQARRYNRLNVYYLLITIVVAVVVTFIGFSGADTIFHLFSKSQAAPNAKNAEAKLIVDVMTLAILIISILGLILRFEQKGNDHNNAVVRLTEFISSVEFKYSGTGTSTPTVFNAADIEIYAERYKSIINSLPATKDKDYYSALKTIKRKKKIKAYIESDKYDNHNFFQRKWHVLWI